LAEALSIAIRKVKVAEASTETIPLPPMAKPKPNWLRSLWKPVTIGGAGLALLFLGILISRLTEKIPLTGVQPVPGVTAASPLTIAPDGVEAITCDGAENGQMGGKSWSPDGKQIAFSGAKTANDPQKLYIINRDDTGLRQITSGNAYDHEVAWSPDGQWIAFHRDCSIWLIHPDGTQNHLLLEDEPNKFCNEGPSWSPNSQEISILRLFDDERPSEIWVVNIDGTNPHIICALDEPVEMGWQAFSPDGSMVTARYLIDDQWTNFLMNVDGNEMHEIDWEPYWWNTQFWPPWGKEIAP
jgi:Tol biopolymer transport system component